MAEAEECCVLQICCEPTLAMRTLADQIQMATHLNVHQALEAATFIRATYDLVPKGMIQPLIDLIAAEAREYPYRSE